jgi:hypothetical protein
LLEERDIACRDWQAGHLQRDKKKKNLRHVCGVIKGGAIKAAYAQAVQPVTA